MTFGISRFLPTDYTGPQHNYAPLRCFPRIPTVTDKKFPIGQLAIIGKNPSSGSQGDLWYLAYFDSSGDAIWIQLCTGSGELKACVVLTSSQVKNLNATPYELVAAQGSGTIIHLLSCMATLNYGGNNPFIAAGAQYPALYLGLAGAGYYADCTTNAFITSSSSQAIDQGVENIADSIATFENLPLNIWNENAEISGNAADDNTLTVCATYTVFDVTG